MGIGIMKEKTSGKEDKFAAALKYDPAKDQAPRVTAAGRGEIAERILETAKREGVVIHQDVMLAQALVNLGVGKVIPPELYQVVAEILVFTARIDQKAKDYIKQKEE